MKPYTQYVIVDSGFTLWFAFDSRFSLSLYLISSGFQVWITKATECAVYCGYFQSIDFHLGPACNTQPEREHYAGA